ncbi:MAG: hypothetical protein EON61_00035 [Alphaproteobacteria bacterium]|jgi:hypothetical protein|nr:MAG: hypothetical protein EON61_00035 [Alphaproteobacteria bacterium]
MTVSIRASLVLSALAMAALTAAFADPRETPDAAKPADNKLHAQEALPSLVELASSSISEDASRRAGERGGPLTPNTQETSLPATGPAPSSPAKPPARSAP